MQSVISSCLKFNKTRFARIFLWFWAILKAELTFFLKHCFLLGHAKNILMNSRDLTFKIMSTWVTIQFFLHFHFWVLLILLLQRHAVLSKRHFHLAILQDETFLWRIMWTFTSECARNLITNRFNLLNNFCIWPPIAPVKKLRCTPHCVKSPILVFKNLNFDEHLQII